MATVRLPSVPVAVVGMEIVCESDDENVTVCLVVLPCDSVHVYWSVTATDSSLERDTVNLAGLPSVIDVWSDEMVAIRVRVLVVAVADQLLAPSELCAFS